MTEHIAVYSLEKIGPPRTAVELCDYMTRRYMPKKDAQLSISQAIDSGKIVVGDEWKLTLK